MLNEKSILAIIPARGGSKGVAQKNLRKVNGVSLVSRTIKQALSNTFIDKVLVSSEDSAILAEAASIDHELCLERPAHLAQDNSSTIDVVLHALSVSPTFDYVLVLQVTSPLRTQQDINQCISHCISFNAPACVSLVRATESPYWMFHLKNDCTLDALLSKDVPHQRQLLNPVYRLNGAIYIADTHWIQIHKTFISDETIGYEMPAENSIDIDTEEDFNHLKHLLKEAY